MTGIMRKLGFLIMVSMLCWCDAFPEPLPDVTGLWVIIGEADSLTCWEFKYQTTERCDEAEREVGTFFISCNIQEIYENQRTSSNKRVLVGWLAPVVPRQQRYSTNSHMEWRYL